MYLAYRNYIVLFFIFCYSSLSYAGGVALAATRIIYPLEAKQTSITLSNTDNKLRFLIQSWVDNSDDKKSNDFIITPPLFVSKPNSENTLRIIYAGKELPKDRESLFWLNTKSIPEIEREQIKDKNVLQLAVLSRIKIFVRPDGLQFNLDDIPNSLEFKFSGHDMAIKNPSPYYVTLVNLHLGDEKLSSIMVPPMETVNVRINNQNHNKISYQTMNDYGASTPVIIKTIAK